LAGANKPALKTAVLMYKAVAEGEGKLGLKKRKKRGGLAAAPAERLRSLQIPLGPLQSASLYSGAVASRKLPPYMKLCNGVVLTRCWNSEAWEVAIVVEATPISDTAYRVKEASQTVVRSSFFRCLVTHHTNRYAKPHQSRS
ncbi:MAG: hypothetical protein ACP5J3_12220, partial [Pyrobaculum sp.]